MVQSSESYFDYLFLLHYISYGYEFIFIGKYIWLQIQPCQIYMTKWKSWWIIYWSKKIKFEFSFTCAPYKWERREYMSLQLRVSHIYLCNFMYSEICHYSSMFLWDVPFWMYLMSLDPFADSIFLLYGQECHISTISFIVGPMCHPLPISLLPQSFPGFSVAPPDEGINHG
jgi:hypothetical protein